MPTVDTPSLAAALNLSAARVSQLAASGVLVRADGGFDERGSLLGYIQFLKRDEATRDSRNRARDRQSMRIEQRYERELRNLLTLDEVRVFADAAFEGMTEYAQAQGQRTFDELKQTMPEIAARVWTYEKVYDPMQAAARAWRDGVHEGLTALENGHMPGDNRIKAIVKDLRKRIDSALTAKPHKAKRPPRRPATPSTETTA